MEVIVYTSKLCIPLDSKGGAATLEPQVRATCEHDTAISPALSVISQGNKTFIYFEPLYYRGSLFNNSLA